MILHITEPYLRLPVSKEAPQVKLHFYAEGIKVQEADIQLGDEKADFYVFMDVSNIIGQEMEICCDISKPLSVILNCAKKEQTDYAYRPFLHFTPEIGWHNDPNGLVYAEGVYHLYYQWNPYGVIWGNMHWGHATSRDLLSWEHQPMVLAPNEFGTVYSGCGFEDKEGITGFGKNALLFYYTAAGGSNRWSKDAGNLHTQRLAVSTDGGNTLVRSDEFLLENIKGENRDPKVFYHKESNAYIMVLYLDGNEFAVFRSADLLHFEETQRICLEGMWECPDLFSLPVDNDENDKKWIFWSADGYYVVGSFDGYRFVPESEVKSAYKTKLPYAAQTYAGVFDRLISVSWLRMKNCQGNYRGTMAIPAEVSLTKYEGDYRLRILPVRELQSRREPCNELRKGQRSAYIPMNDKPLEVTMSWESKEETGQTKLQVGDTLILADFEKHTLEFHNPAVYEEPVFIDCKKEHLRNLKLIIDREVIEFYGNEGTIYGAVETEENLLVKEVRMDSSVKIDDMRWYYLMTEGE